MSTSRSSAPRRIAAGLVAGALCVLGVAIAPDARAKADVATDRLAGVNRYATAAAIAGQADFAGATTAILATGEGFPDALAAAGLAGSNAPAPIVLTQSGEYSSEAQDALAALGSLEDVIIVGGTAAISEAVAAAVTADGYDVTRVAGNDRYETAAAIATAIGAANVGQVDSLKTALIATGAGFADALAGGPLAAANSMPILLVQANEIPVATQDALEDLGIEQAAILGGTAAVSDDVAGALEDITGNPAIRVAGETRFGTAAEAGRFGVTELGWGPADVVLANGLNFPDALAAGPLGGLRRAPIILAASLPEESQAFLDEFSDSIERITVAGGTAAVDEATVQAAETAAEDVTEDAPSGGDTVTSSLLGPELQSVTLASTDADDLAVVYNFTFDTELDEESADAASFKLYNTDTRNPSSGDIFNDGDDIEVDGDTASVAFNLADYGVGDATLGAVAEGAVEDTEGNVNPPQSLATAGNYNSAPAGLVSVEVTDADAGTAEFTFDRPIIPGQTVQYQYDLIARDGTVYSANDIDETGESNTSPDDDEPSTVVEVQFFCADDDDPYVDGECDEAEAGDAADLSGVTLRRGIARTNPSTGGLVAPEDVRIEAADMGGGTTDAPDLTSIETASDNEDLDDAQVLFVFDEALEDVDTAAADSYGLVYSHCDPNASESVNDLTDTLGGFDPTPGDAQTGDGFDDLVTAPAACVLHPTSITQIATSEDDHGNRSVLATFPNDDVDNAFLIGAQVDDAAEVTEAQDAGLMNGNDEVAYTAAGQSDLYDDGSSSGPQVLSATATMETGFGGDFDHFEVTITFDETLDEDSFVPGSIAFWSEDGEVTDTTALDDCEIDDDTKVVCEIDDADSTILDVKIIVVDAGAVAAADAVAIDEDETAVQFTNPETSVSVDAPEEPPADE